jgi:hypothetical protein
VVQRYFPPVLENDHRLRHQYRLPHLLTLAPGRRIVLHAPLLAGFDAENIGDGIRRVLRSHQSFLLVTKLAGGFAGVHSDRRTEQDRGDSGRAQRQGNPNREGIGIVEAITDQHAGDDHGSPDHDAGRAAFLKLQLVCGKCSDFHKGRDFDCWSLIQPKDIQQVYIRPARVQALLTLLGAPDFRLIRSAPFRILRRLQHAGQQFRAVRDTQPRAGVPTGAGRVQAF